MDKYMKEGFRDLTFESLARKESCVKGKIVRSGKFVMTCITYKLGGGSPLDGIAGVLVKDQGEQKQVEKYLKQLYEFDDKEHYERFIADFIVTDKEIVNG